VKKLECVNPECSLEFTADQLLGIGKFNGGRGVTPCCRNLYWYGPDGHLAGRKMGISFCEKCRSYVCEVEFEPILKKEIPRPKLWHDRCSPEEKDSHYEYEALQWLHNAGYDLESMVKSLVWYIIPKKKKVNTRAMEKVWRKVVILLAREIEKKTDLKELYRDVILSGIWDKKFGIRRKIDPRWQKKGK